VMLGHAQVRVQPTKSGRRWELECDCGWGAPVGGHPTVTCATELEAAKRAVWHVKSSVDRYLAEQRKSGVSFGVREGAGL
jgi:alkylation response protein AidB-like acyl-CoA dehydrogenase